MSVTPVQKTLWSLGAKLALVGTPFLIAALLSTVATLWVSWQLDGGAAAVNEAGRMRMQAYRMALVLGGGEFKEFQVLAGEYEKSLSLLRNGDAERPLFVPWDDTVRAHFTKVEADWVEFKNHWVSPAASAYEGANVRTQTAMFVADIENLVVSIEQHIAHWTAILHLLQLGVLSLAILGATVLIFTGYRFVLEPVQYLKQAIQKIQSGDLSARVMRVTSDEFGTLADGFNGMAEHLQLMYANLESKVKEKTLELEEKRERLESLYEVTAMVARATTLDELAQDFSQSMMRIAHADGVAVRWSDQANQRFMLLASSGLPVDMVKDEHCLHAGDCHCGNMTPGHAFRVIPIHESFHAPHQHCVKAGFSTVLNLPIRIHDRVIGEVDLFFHALVSPSEAERSLLEALNSHLASAVEKLRLNALGKEAAVSEERHLIARELHDSIAQSLAFLKIQVQLMRDALRRGSALEIQSVLEEIDVGVRESYGDVRELLMHFRTRANTEDIEPALATTLRKFEHQTGMATAMSHSGHGLPLSADLQIQVLHIVQEALSNVRKHAKASKVWLDVQQQPVWRFEVRDNGIGFEIDQLQKDETHVGLSIMTERAQRIGANLEFISTLQSGSSVILTLAGPFSTIASEPSEPSAASLQTQSA
ncbi:MAG: type IV pili methyl-accepting chemotaxis transducer N-terminal domain-containing protein [Burkholderiales bacterium]|nr:type IV pili methyl-accepting chemotaxis transducer N-terminal domain-containing protein [Burkholderiales bacterium]